MLSGTSPVRLERSFRTPPIDPARETVRLRLEAVPGLLRVWLNGEPLHDGPGDCDALDLPLTGRLRDRNLLALEFDPSRAGERPWGQVALVIEGVPTLADP
jgi:hypothetical protein